MAASIAVRVSRLSDVNDRRLWAVMAVVSSLVIWLAGAAVTKFSLERMAYYTPIAVVVVGATVGLVLLWVKVVSGLSRQPPRRAERRPRGVRSSPCRHRE